VTPHPVLKIRLDAVSCLPEAVVKLVVMSLVSSDLRGCMLGMNDNGWW
jgi:hypothetical protein